MIQSRQEPEYSLEEKSARTFPQWDHSRISDQILLDQVVASSKLLSRVLIMLVDTSERIQDSLLELRLSERERM